MEIRFKNLAVMYEKDEAYNVVLKKINYTFESSTFYFINGTEQSGKSTILELICLLCDVTAGKLYFNDKDTTYLPEISKTYLRSRHISFVSQIPVLNEHLTVRENILLKTYIRNAKYEEKLDYYLKKFKLENKDGFFPSELSLTEQYKVCLLRALITNPDILLIDDILGFFTHENQVALLKHFRELAEDGKMVIYVSNNDLAYDFAHRNLELEDGYLYEL